MEVYMSVKNFGQIEEARVNISNFTIFVGNNNTGKTQLMELAYAVIKQVATLSPSIGTPQIGNIDAFSIGIEEIKLLNEWVNKYLHSNIDKIIDETFNASIPIDEITLEFECIDCSYEIYFLTDKTIEYVVENKIMPNEQLAEIVLNKKGDYQTVIISKNAEGAEERRIANKFFNNFPIELAKTIETGRILGNIVGGRALVSSNILFLPASRMGLMLLYKHYFRNAGQDKDAMARDRDAMVRDRNQNSKGITKPVLDFVSFLLQHSYTERVAKKNEKIIQFIYGNLIDGTISEFGDATMYTPKDNDSAIPIFVASSMVNEVVPVVKALTDSDNIDYIFYDEVETSMHPIKQIEMVKLLNRLNNNGIKLLVSTHSDTMATKINNLLLLSHGDLDFQEAKKELGKKGIFIEEEDLLISKHIHVYQFVKNERGKSSVQELEFRKVPCTGYDFSLFNDSTMNLFEEAKIAMGIEDED